MDQKSNDKKHLEVVPKNIENIESKGVFDDYEEKMGTGKAILVIFMLITMYALCSALPTFLLMYFAKLSFWSSQGISFVCIVLIVWAFGLYKPASNEQKLKSKFLL